MAGREIVFFLMTDYFVHCLLFGIHYTVCDIPLHLYSISSCIIAQHTVLPMTTAVSGPNLALIWHRSVFFFYNKPPSLHSRVVFEPWLFFKITLRCQVIKHVYTIYHAFPRCHPPLSVSTLCSVPSAAARQSSVHFSFHLNLWRNLQSMTDGIT